MTGAAIAGSRILDTTTEKLTPDRPAPTSTAPINPPNNACEELTQLEQPGHQVPQDGGGQAREDHRRGDQGVVDDAAGDGLGHGGGQKGPGDVEHRGDQHRDPGSKRTGSDRGGHGIGAVESHW